MNTLGAILRTSVFGESHGSGIGALLDGIPAGIPVIPADIQARLHERSPGRVLTSARRESDQFEILSGVYKGHTTGAPVSIWISNADARPQDYDESLPRPGHADLGEYVASGGFNDPRGGGHRSGRLTAPLVAAAALIEPLLSETGITVGAHLESVGQSNPRVEAGDGPLAWSARAMQKSVRRAAASDGEPALPSCSDAAPMLARIDDARRARDSIGGIVAWRADGVGPSLGRPMLDALDARLAQALVAIPGVKGVSFGTGFAAAGLPGSQNNDAIGATVDGTPEHIGDSHGGIIGGRSTGRPVWGHAAFKPTPSIAATQQTARLGGGGAAALDIRGRHDPCIAIRGTPVVRAVLELTLADFVLLRRAGQPTPTQP